MKIKSDFVTNSSSSSFTIPKSILTKSQIHMIINHIELAAVMINKYPHKNIYLDEWKIENKKDVIEGYTSMDNFDMEWFLINVVKVDIEKINFEGSNFQ